MFTSIAVLGIVYALELATWIKVVAWIGLVGSVFRASVTVNKN